MSAAGVPEGGGARRPRLIGTSTKMNLTSPEVAAWCDAVRAGTAGLAGVELFVLPSFPTIWAARDRLDGSPIAWGAQDVHPDASGAHTGDVSAGQLADLGCTFVETGHSERRRDHGESDALIARKVAAILGQGMRPILCVGEPEPGSLEPAARFVAGQVEAALGAIPPEQAARVVVAYEPVWAIGVGARPADPAHVDGVHRAIAAWLAGWAGPDAGPVIYGGSVDPGSAPGLLALPSVDGLFVGRAALDPMGFIAIARAGATARG